MFQKKDHPVLLFFYYVNIMVVTMFTNHPVVITLAAIGGILWLSLLVGRRTFYQAVAFYLLLTLLITVTNPLFSHRGETVYFFLNGNAVTKEALRYGLFMGIKMTAVFAYSRCFSIRFRVNDFLCLFGRISPKLALLLSLALSFLPRFKRQAREVSKNQKTMGMYGGASIMDRILSEVRVFDSLITWSLETGITTADSMNARGYGEGHRTSYTLYRFKGKDARSLGFLVLLFAASYLAYSLGYYDYFYYPRGREVVLTMEYVMGYSMAGVVALLPVFEEIKEKIKWNVLESRI